MTEVQTETAVQDGGNEGKAVAEPPPGVEPPPGQETGEKSTWLTQTQGGILDDSPGYEGVTDGVPEKGIFTLIGGYLDDNGDLHKEVDLRAMSGHEEDLLGNRSVPITQRMSGIMSACVQRIGTVTDRGQVSRAVNRLPAGSRTHLLICMRRTTHWKRTKDIYEMEVACPRRTCEKEGHYKVDLGELDLFEMPDPKKRQYEVGLVDSGAKVVWRITTGADDQILSVVSDFHESEAEILTYSILIRMASIDGENCELDITDFLDSNHKKLRPSKKAQALKLWVKNLAVGDRELLREDFFDKEPSVDTDLEFTCKFCQRDFTGPLNVGQESFFFPSAISRRSKRRSST